MEGRPDPYQLAGLVADGKYRFEHCVGEGGFGVVYRGTHIGFDVPIAIKCLKLPTLLDASAEAALLEKLREEGRLLMRLSQRTPGIVQALDVGIFHRPTGQSLPYLVLEWLDGRTLSHELRARASLGQPNLTIREARDLLAPAARALAVAHAESVAHRDIKPENLMILRSTSGTTVKVLDFGIAKVLEEARVPSPEATSTTPAAPVFTPGYAAPEQFEKARGATGPWTDVFSLAVVFVETVSGARALRGDELVEIYRATTDPDTRPTLRRLGVEAPEQVEAVLARALHIHPGQRYPNAGDFWTALDSAIDASVPTDRLVVRPALTPVTLGATAELSMAPTQEITTKSPLVATAAPPPPTPRRSVGIIAMSVVALGLVGVGAFMFSRLNHDARPAAGTTASASSAALVEPTFGLSAVADYHDPPAKRFQTLTSKSLWANAKADLDAACVQPGAPARWCAVASFAAGMHLLQGADYAAALSLFEAATKLDPSWATPYVALCSVLGRRGDLDGALAAAGTAERLEPGWWVPIAAGARALASKRKFEEAITEYRRAYAIAPKSVALLADMALMYHAAGMDTKSDRFIDEALSIEPELAYVWVIRSERAYEKKQAKEALSAADRALGISPLFVPAHLARAEALWLDGRSDDARTELARAEELAKENASDAESRLASVRRLLGGALADPIGSTPNEVGRPRTHPAPTGTTRTPPPSVGDPVRPRTMPKGCACGPSDMMCLMKCKK
ncbi:MAG: serine/threonine-protein kinase [Polyangiaceae bacterium]